MPKKSTTFEKQFTDEPKKIVTKKPAAAERPIITNPFFIATTGLEWMFARARNVAILLLVLTIISFVFSVVDIVRNPTSQQPIDTSWITPEVWATVAPIVLLVTILIAALSFFLQGIIAYTSAKVALGQSVELGETLRAVLKRFWGVVGLYLLLGIKVLLWSLLAIVPGIIMAVRYSLAGTIYFAEPNTSPNQAIKRSAALTKGSFMTVLGAKVLLNALTFGIISELVDMGSNTVLYRQLKDIEAKKLPTPEAHWLSWLTTVLFFTGLAGLVFLFALLIVYANQMI